MGSTRTRFGGRWVLMLSISAIAACTTPQRGAVQTAEKVPCSAVEPFPQAWQGKYVGQLEIYTPKGVAQQVPMSLELQPLDSGRWRFHTRYASDDSRPYDLLPGNAQGHFVTDEHNGILLDDYYYGGTLYGRFAVGGNDLLVTYRKQCDTIVYETLVTDTAVFRRSQAEEQGQLFSVNTHRVRSMQRARLVKIVR